MGPNRFYKEDSRGGSAKISRTGSYLSERYAPLNKEIITTKRLGNNLK